MQVTELLYLKQTQLERMAAEKAAQQMALERELTVAREEAARVQRCSPPASSHVYNKETRTHAILEMVVSYMQRVTRPIFASYSQ